MANLALIYPTLNPDDFASIQKVREEHDPKYFDVVDPHFTLVFSTNKLAADGLVKHVRSALAGSKPFRVMLDSAIVVEDDSGEFFHTFLVPSEGFDEINRIHDTLYTGDLESEPRHDIPFIPHLGIGTGSKNDMEDLARRLNENAVQIEGTADKITVVEYDGKRVSDYSVVPLV